MGLLARVMANAAPAGAPRTGDRFAAPNVRTLPGQWASAPSHAKLGPRMAVGSSSDLSRVLALPKRPAPELETPDDPKCMALIALARDRFGRENPKCECEARFRRPCLLSLKPPQAWALHEMTLMEGLLGPLAVGSGKTALDIFAPLAVPNCRQAVVLVPPGLRDQFLREYDTWAQHWQVPSLVMDGGRRGRIVAGQPVLHVVAWSILSRPESTQILESLRPDLLILDEAHKAKARSSACTRRLLRYMAEHPETRLCAWSGTLTKNSLRDYGHISAWSLGAGSPLPVDPEVLDEWSAAIDASDWPAPMGALSALCEPGEHVRDGFHRRLVGTPGVVATRAGSSGGTILIEERQAPKIPAKLAAMIEDLRETWTRPDGEELIDALQTARSLRELACGFYYKWVFPRGEPKELIKRWFEARRDWHKEMRERLKRPGPHMDSPLLVTNAARRYYAGYEGDLPTWQADSWPAWLEVRDAVQHDSVPEWVDDYLAADAAAWAKSERGVVWYMHDAFGRRAGELSGLPVFGADTAEEIAREDGSRSIIASIHAHGTGRDGLQRIFARQLVTNPPSSGLAWEQLLGRLSRIGQQADEVVTQVYRHTPEMRDAWDKAEVEARYVQGTMGTRQNLLSATVAF